MACKSTPVGSFGGPTSPVSSPASSAGFGLGGAQKTALRSEQASKHGKGDQARESQGKSEYSQVFMGIFMPVMGGQG